MKIICLQVTTLARGVAVIAPRGRVPTKEYDLVGIGNRIVLLPAANKRKCVGIQPNCNLRFQGRTNYGRQ